MKRRTSLFSAIAFAALITLPAFSFAGKGDDSDKKKNISKTYTVTSSDKLNIENSFGNVMINTWDKSEIRVDIEIGAKASSDEKAQEILDEIEVSEHRSDNNIYFKTNVGDIHNDSRHKDNDGDRKFYIDYTVHMPSGNPLNLENSFGKTTVPDFKGPIDLTSKFGSLTAGKLDNVQEVDVEFGSATIGQVRNGKVTIKYSDSKIENVSGNVKINSEFSGQVQLGLDKDISELSLNESYSTVRMTVSKDFSANFDIHTSFGNFHNNTDFSIREDRDDNDNGPRFDKDYSGKAGEGKAKIKIKSSFGTVRLSDSNNNSNSDDDKDDKSRNKSRKEKVSV